MKLLVGCPISRRGWVLPWWFEALQRAVPDGWDVAGLFVGDGLDNETWEAMQGAPFSWSLVRSGEKSLPFHRDWSTAGRYAHMAELRNRLLDHVRFREPDLFLSLDSDVLLHPAALSLALENIGRFDAVGMACHMTPLVTNAGPVRGSTMAPNYGMYRDQRLVRPMLDPGVRQVDVIMAAKLMSPVAYSVDYRTHRLGEDIGWSLSGRKAGVTFGWDNRVWSRHVMAPSELAFHDPRCPDV